MWQRGYGDNKQNKNKYSTGKEKETKTIQFVIMVIWALYIMKCF